jgi:hypothetical protein
LASDCRVRDCGGGGGAEICDDCAFIGKITWQPLMRQRPG